MVNFLNTGSISFTKTIPIYKIIIYLNKKILCIRTFFTTIENAIQKRQLKFGFSDQLNTPYPVCLQEDKAYFNTLQVLE